MRVLLLIAAIVVPVLAHAEPAKIGVLTFVAQPQLQDAFRKGLRDQGLVEGKDVTVEWRSADGRQEIAENIAAEFARTKVSVIVGSLTGAVLAASKATKTIPIVMAPVADPIKTGIVSNLAHPGGNITGISNVAVDVNGKLLGLLREVQPTVKRVGIVVVDFSYGNTAARAMLKEAEAVASKSGIGVVPIWLKGTADTANAFKAAQKEGVQAILVQPLLATKEVADLARQHRLPSIATGVAAHSFPRYGGLLGYGSDPAEHFQRAAFYVARILRGAKPGDLPVELSNTFELVVNAKTAKAIGLTIPKDMLVRAIEVIE